MSYGDAGLVIIYTLKFCSDCPFVVMEHVNAKPHRSMSSGLNLAASRFFNPSEHMKVTRTPLLWMIWCSRRWYRYSQINHVPDRNVCEPFVTELANKFSRLPGKGTQWKSGRTGWDHKQFDFQPSPFFRNRCFIKKSDLSGWRNWHVKHHSKIASPYISWEF